MNEPVERPESHAPASSSWSFDGVQLSVRIMGAENAASGGDWCEAFVAGNGVIALSIGDVSGHGVQKNATMVAIRAVIRAAARRGCDPAQTLMEAHAFLRAHDSNEYATAIFAYLDVGRQRLTIANAGHPPPLMCFETGAYYLAEDGHDLPLGIEDAFSPALRHIAVPEAALLVFYSDGVTEHDREPLHGEAELRDAAIFAYNFASLPTASVIEKQMHLTGSNRDDVAILTAWTPRLFRQAVQREA